MNLPRNQKKEIKVKKAVSPQTDCSGHCGHCHKNCELGYKHPGRCDCQQKECLKTRHKAITSSQKTGE